MSYRDCANISDPLLDAIEDLYLHSRNKVRDLAVVDRLQELRQDALAEDQPMDLDSVTQFTGFLTHNPDIPSPKTITLTPDGTVRARWKGVPEASDHIAFEFKGGSYTTIRADFS